MFNMFPNHPSLARDPPLLSLGKTLLSDPHLLLLVMRNQESLLVT